jgi:adenylate cyclase
MWNLVIHLPGEEARRWALRPGVTTIGRMLKNDIILPDTLISRRHAEIELGPKPERLVIRDRGSINGTRVNLIRLEPGRDYHLKSEDAIQIGATQISVLWSEASDIAANAPVLESHPAVALGPDSIESGPFSLLYDVARELNTVSDTEVALQAVSRLMKDWMGADRCEVILAGEFCDLREKGFSVTIAAMAMDRRSPVIVPEVGTKIGKLISDSAGWLLIRSALCAPVMNGDAIIALIYLYKCDPEARPFDEQDANMAEAVSHMVALTIERMNLFQRIHDEQRLRQLLQSRLAPEGAEQLLHNYLKTGRLPGLGEETATVLVVDIADSTRWAEQLGARLFGRILKKYYREMTRVVLDHGGRLDKYLGDGIMALFGLSGDRNNSEKKAIYAGLEMLALFESIEYLGGAKMHLGVGVNTGPVMAGYIDTQERIDFVVLGDAVNVAFGLQALARPNRLFIGQSTYDAVCEAFKSSEIGPVAIKGRAESVTTYEILRKGLQLPIQAA